MDRYLRQKLVSWLGHDGQEALSRSSVLVVGCGGIGSTSSTFLARAGIGRLRLVDRDVVSLTDLHRQIHYTEEDLQGLHLKVAVAERRLRASNSEVEVEPVAAELNPSNVTDLANGIDLILDCSDNFATRMLINEVAVKYRIPWIHGACLSSSGMVIPFADPTDGCYRCVVGDVLERFNQPEEPLPILGPTAGAVGSIQALEAIKLLVNPDLSAKRMIHFDGATMVWETVEVTRRADCPVCSKRNFDLLSSARRWQRSFRQVDGVYEVDLPEMEFDLLKARLADRASEIVKGALVIRSQGMSIALFADGKALVRGVESSDQARNYLESLLG